MQRGIDSFFKRVTPAATKTESNAKSADSPDAKPKKRKARVISSDEDEIPESPQVSKIQNNKKSRLDEAKTQTKKSPKKNEKKSPTPKKDLKRVDPFALFGGETKRVAAPKPAKPKNGDIISLDDDDEFDQSLMEIDLDASVLAETAKQNVVNGSKEKQVDEKRKSPKDKKEKSSKETTSPSSAKKLKQERPPETPKSEEIKQEKHSETPKSENIKQEKHSETLKSEEIKQEKHSETPKSENIKQEKHSETPKTEKIKHERHLDTPKSEKRPSKATSKSKKPAEDLETSVLTDEERFERKRMAAALYQKFKNRSAVLNPGSKEVPKGKPNCLAGLNFLITGVLESLERDEAASIIKEYGGKVASTVGKRLNYMIVGEEAGPKKLAQADEFGIKILSEDDFLDLIRQKSGLSSKTSKDDKQAEDKAVKIKEEKPSTSPKNKKSTSKKEEKPAKIKSENEFNNNENMKLEIKQEKQQSLSNNVKQETFSSEQQNQQIDENMMAWVDKYKPSSVKEIIGQQGAASNVAKLMNWLSKWYINNDGKKKHAKPNPWAKNDDGAAYKAALLSGPPGIGKTTTATLVCKELGFDAVEFNASDTRSKRLLKEEVSELLSNKSLHGYFSGKGQAVTKKHVLIMDEVDGMAGNEDRGGIQELIGLIKESHVPIICMCNDRNHQKMRSLVNYCYDLRFNKPRVEQIKGRILSICFKEKVKLEPARIEEIIAATNNDIRQSINHIALLSANKDLDLKHINNGKSTDKTAQKDLKLGPWEATRRIFSAQEHKSMSFNDQCDLFFHDYSMTPLFVQQNYLMSNPNGPRNEVLNKVALTADSLSLGDLVDKRIRSSNAWSLLPAQAVFSSALPGIYMEGNLGGQINFPGWLGKNSRSTKRSRLAQEIHDHTRIRTSGSRLSVRMDYAPFLLDKIVRPLRERGNEGIEEALSVIKEYHLLREDIDSLIELSAWPGKKSPLDAVDGRVKAALTRAYNKEVMAYSYSVMAGVKKKKAEAVDDADMLCMTESEEGAVTAVESGEEDDDNLENDGLIKAKKPTAAKATSSAKASTSKKAAAGATSKAKSSTSRAKK